MEETNTTYRDLKDMDDKKFYEAVGIGKFPNNYRGHHRVWVALDSQMKIITTESNPEMARSIAIEKGCHAPWIVNSSYLKKSFFEKHNKRLEEALSKKIISK